MGFFILNFFWVFCFIFFGVFCFIFFWFSIIIYHSTTLLVYAFIFCHRRNVVVSPVFFDVLVSSTHL